jgi:hypothetical protein
LSEGVSLLRFWFLPISQGEALRFFPLNKPITWTPHLINYSVLGGPRPWWCLWSPAQQLGFPLDFPSFHLKFHFAFCVLYVPCSVLSRLSFMSHCSRSKAECTFWFARFLYILKLSVYMSSFHEITQCKQSRHPEIVTSVFSPFEYFVIFLRYLWT